ncbi:MULTISPECIES: tRNA (adenosine(37)-N6)-threonylcarbamoyltransferase complex ATPase subunit type 1 TsaE [unclassified Adlercreutzia]|uniref:tRNA (adenosine(37)-N6)-threonylcarbamoyltransferase complex ATPase subunit type 1 TsaE n=1 Tax=unclassified Adlercreutzia TaxID=2636013 RepID=UPI001980953E|nr:MULTISPECIES: tRNA (adenosine(37)-N6)-threonylcarbamoyltransferase complex ATPase subunit type 1 TsaE [unclassified Adlercreutzia]
MASGLTYLRKTSSAEATKQLASTLAPFLHEGDVVVLNGDLGAGKTQFVQGVAAALGVTSPVTSPTFNILLTYDEGRIPLHHLDLYRLDDASELEDIDYYALIDGDSDGATFVEWAEKFPDELPCDYLEITIAVDAAGQRIVRAHSCGSRARQLLFVWASDSRSRLSKTAGSAR